MKRVHVRIVSEIDGKKSISGGRGELSRDLISTTLFYSIGEDRVTVFVSDEEVVMEREGSCYLRLVFRPGQSTEGIVGLSRDQSGEIAVFTEKAECELFADGQRIELKYYLLFGEEKQETVLRLIAKTEQAEEKR